MALHKTPPAEYLSEWANTFGRLSPISPAKRAKGYNVGEAPGASHLNFLYRNVGNWQEIGARSLAAKMAFRNIEFNNANVIYGSTPAITAAVHIDYDSLSGYWYLSCIDTAGNVYVQSSADGEPGTWTTTKFIVNVGAGSNGDFSKIVTDGTICGITADLGGTFATFYASSDLDADNISTSGTVISGMIESSDLTYDDTNNLWICCGRSSTRGVICTASDPTGTWTLRKTFTTDTDATALATNEDGQSVCTGGTESYYSSNGTTWTAATTPAPVADQAAWAPSLGLFVVVENSTRDLWTSTDGDVWRDQNAINSVPGAHQLAYGRDFMWLWTTPVTSTNGRDYSDVYAFTTKAVNADDYNYQLLGQVWGDSIPFVNTLNGVFRSGPGKLIYPYTNLLASSDFRLAVARYGAESAFDLYF